MMDRGSQILPVPEPQLQPHVQGEQILSAILDEALCNEQRYEIPLRSMFELNLEAGRTVSYAVSGFASPPLQQQKEQQHSPDLSSPTATQESNDPASILKVRLLQQIAGRPAQHFRLPPSFLTSFIRRCFVAELEYVDFPQAFTALDYLKDLESRRADDLTAALKRLAIVDDPHCGIEPARLPAICRWRESIEEKSRAAAAVYSQIYLRLRQWTMVNEMMLTPYSKTNCVAMLNTLFPPKMTSPPTRHISIQRMLDQRRKFFGYIRALEKGESTDCLRKIIIQEARNGEPTGWPVTHEYVEKYLYLANELITVCNAICNSARDNFDDVMSPRRYKADSGISLNNIVNGERPASSSTNGTMSSAGSCSRSSRFLHHHKHVLSTTTPVTPATAMPTLGAGQGQEAKTENRSTLERIGKEIRKMRSRADIGTEEKKPRHTKSLSALRKIKSLGRLKGSDRNGAAAEQQSDSSFDVEEFKRKRILWESKNGRATQKAAAGAK